MYEYTNEVVRVNQLKVIKNTPNLYSESWTDQILSIQTHYEQIHIDEGDRINYIVFELPQNQVLIEPEFDGED